MDVSSIEQSIKVNVYHIPSDANVPLHEHPSQDEIFYCIGGEGFGVLKDKEIQLQVGDVFVAPAGQLHSLRSEGDLYVTAVLVPVNRIICQSNDVSYNNIRKAMVNGARTVEEVRELTGAGIACECCTEEIKKILSIACTCKMISMKEVVDAVKNGADTLEKVEEQTGACTACGKCEPLVQNIIDNKR